MNLTLKAYYQQPLLPVVRELLIPEKANQKNTFLVEKYEYTIFVV